jgi:beta-phosphoglucomutase-like phosphatase (HAD superfamily)
MTSRDSASDHQLAAYCPRD